MTGPYQTLNADFEPDLADQNDAQAVVHAVGLTRVVKPIPSAGAVVLLCD